MVLFGFLRRKPPVRDAGSLADFMDLQAAFLIQKGIYEYARARAGPYAKALFAEASFLAQVEQSRWRAYPLGIAMVTEMIEGVLRPHAADAEALRGTLERTALGVFDRYPKPAAIDEEEWRAARDRLAQAVAGVGLHRPKRVADIPEPYAEPYFALMPIHERLRGRDFPTIRNYLRITLCNIHDELTERLDAAALVGALGAGAT